MSNALFLSLVRQFANAAALPSAANALADLPNTPALYFTVDTRALYLVNPASKAIELLVQFIPVTVANLPTVGKVIGSEAVVSDATTPALGSTVVGAGAVQVAVIWDGTNWKVA